MEQKRTFKEFLTVNKKKIILGAVIVGGIATSLGLGYYLGCKRGVEVFALDVVADAVGEEVIETVLDIAA